MINVKTISSTIFSINHSSIDRELNLASLVGLAESEQLFIKCREEFRRSVKYSGNLYSDFSPCDASLPYFHISDEYRMFNPEGIFTTYFNILSCEYF